MDLKYSFESFIMQCCKAREWNLRAFLKKTLIKNGFNIIEDDYQTYRGEKYANVHNMLAIRGNPRVCLVAHTDVCRDHAYGNPEVNPVIKIVKDNDEMKTIIQDRDCSVQVGGDDRLGVAINTWIALNTGYDMGLLFTTDEEVGLVSAEYVKFPELLNFDLLVQVDRGNHSNQLVTNISGHQMCSPLVARRLLKISEEINLPRYEVHGFLTDVLALRTNHMCKEAVNMTCGYHNSIGADRDEYIDIQESKDTMKYVASIIQYYDLNRDEDEDFSLETEEIDDDLEDSFARLEREFIEAMNRDDSPKRYEKEREEEDLFSEASYNRDRGIDEDIDMDECYPMGFNFSV